MGEEFFFVDDDTPKTITIRTTKQFRETFLYYCRCANSPTSKGISECEDFLNTYSKILQLENWHKQNNLENPIQTFTSGYTDINISSCIERFITKLINHGIDINFAKNNKGYTLLELIIYITIFDKLNAIGIIKLLLSHGVNINNPINEFCLGELEPHLSEQEYQCL